MKSSRIIHLAAAMVAFLGLSQTHASLITSSAPLAPYTVIDFQQFTTVNYANSVPVQVGTPVGLNVELYGYGTYDTYVGPTNHSLGGNGLWDSGVDPNFYSVRLPVSTATAFEFVFNTAPVMGVGGFMNYAPSTGPVSIAAYDSGGILLESYVISSVAPISTPGGLNDGAFRGILRSSTDIASFRVSGGYAVLDNLTLAGVPEPASLTLLALGTACLLKRRKEGL